ncbi:MAG: hypothetical protein SPL00_02820 [Bacilli bacterium]|nr:hypothetical protein [Bacilli bacterium]
MATENFSIKFTDETYASKTDIKTILKTSLIYKIFTDVSAYRKKFSVDTRLIAYNSRNFSITMTPKLRDIFARFETSLSSLTNSFFAEKLNENSKNSFKNYCLNNCLNALNTISNLNTNELTIKAIVTGAYRENNPKHNIFIQYKKALLWIEENYGSTIDENIVANLYSILSNTNELTEFYRVTETVNRNTTSLIGTKYNQAPVILIDSMMNNFFEFIKDPNIKPFIKALVTLYYINYVKPFVNYNEEMSLLIAKLILAHEQISSFAPYFCLENVLIKTNMLDDYILSISDEYDLTYIITYGINILSPLIKLNSDDIIRMRSSAIREENYVVDNIDRGEEFVPKEQVKEEQTQLVKKAPSSLRKKDMNNLIRAEYEKEVVFAIKPKQEVISEKDIKDIAKYILEINPNVKKMQAFFFASHCTIGRYYSIQDYKKYARCAYETARTSMENLVSQGFYEKVQVQNKFFYTPIKQGDSK